MEIPFDRLLWTPPRARMAARLWGSGEGPVTSLVAGWFDEAAQSPAFEAPSSPARPSVGEARSALELPMLRRRFVRALRAARSADGLATDGVSAIASLLGAELPRALDLLTLDRPEAIVALLSPTLVDDVEWDDDARPCMFWPWPLKHLKITGGARIRVSTGQVAVVYALSDGPVPLDVLRPGDHRVEPDILAGFAQATSWTGGPSSIGVMFMSTGATENLRWGTQDAVQVNATRPIGNGDALQIRAYGRASVSIARADLAFTRFCQPVCPTDDEFSQRVLRMAAGRFAEGLKQLADVEGLAPEHLADDLPSLGTRVRPYVERKLAEAGLTLRRLELENITGPVQVHLRTTGGSNRHAQPTPPPEPRVSCISCLSSVLVKAKFCTTCGASQRRACAKCGADMAARGKFCPACGEASA